MRLTVLLILLSTYFIINSCSAQICNDIKKPYDIIGVGLSEIDILTFVDDEYIKRHLTIPYGISKGKVSFTDNATWNTLRDNLKEFHLLPSGEIASLLFVYASLGGKPAFNTVLANDEYGQHFLSNIESLGITLTNKQNTSSKKTAANLVFVTPNGTSTYVITHNDIVTINQKDIKYHQIKDYKVVISESALWDGASQAQAIVRAFNIAEKVGTKRVFLLSDIYPAKKYKQDFLNLINRLDILITNEKSMLELASALDFDKMIEVASKFNILTVITLEDKGAIVVKGPEIHYINASHYGRGKIIDKTGSQAAFAAGFLYGYINGKSIPESGKIAARTASYITRQVGRYPQSNFSEVLYENSNN